MAIELEKISQENLGIVIKDLINSQNNSHHIWIAGYSFMGFNIDKIQRIDLHSSHLNEKEHLQIAYGTMVTLLENQIIGFPSITDLESIKINADDIFREFNDWIKSNLQEVVKKLV